MSKGIDKKVFEDDSASKITITHNVGGTQKCGTNVCPLMDIREFCKKDEKNCDGAVWKCDAPFNHSAK